MTRRITLPSMTPHEIIVQATDYFSRGEYEAYALDCD
jgi:hypothetical protein